MAPKIKNLKKAADRIRKAIKKKERIIVYGDADMDGVASVIILKEAIKNLGGENPIVYFPDREKEGYGISEAALLKLEQYSPALFVAVDCGIGNFKEVTLAKKLGFEVIIVDHHEILDKLPDTPIIVDPKQKGDRYPFKQFAAVGLVFRLAEQLFKDKMPEAIRKNFLELAAQATIADMMPRTDDNELIIAEGLSSISSSWRPGMQILLGLEDFKDLNLMERIYKVNSLLNVRDVQDNLPVAFRILTAQTREEAMAIIETLFAKYVERKEKIKKITEDLDRKVSRAGEGKFIFAGEEDWDITLLGVVASTAVQKYQKPVFLFKKMEKESHGGIRAPKGFNVVEAMKTCSGLFITYGGHPQAAGFRIKNENVAKLKECLSDYFSKQK